MQQFIWLGVLPDDVTITEKMAMTLWDCRLTEAKKTLRYLRGKALLLTGVSSEQITNYRVHDLLHDLARNLLQASPHSETDYQLSGLGLSISEAHRQLLTRYQRQTKNALWNSLEDDGYIYNQLIWHLEKAEKIGEIHQLLREETAEGGNGWYSKCEKEGKTATFIKDVSRAWQLAEADFVNNPSQAIGLQVRYGLITTSLNSLAGNMPPELIAELVKHEIWTPAQGLAYVRQNQDDGKQAAGLRAISLYLPPALLPEALEVARAIGYESSRAEALTGLAPHLPESLLPEALEVARSIGDKYYRVEALTGLAPHLPEVLPEALEVTRAIGYQSSRAEALIGLAPHLPENLFPKALEVARSIGDKYYRVEALTGLAPHLPEVLPEALEVTRAIEEKYRARALIGLAPHLPESLFPEALEIARAIGLFALTGLAPYLPEVLPEALEIARGIGDESSRAKALARLSPYLPEVLPEALEIARVIKDESKRTRVLAELVPYSYKAVDSGGEQEIAEALGAVVHYLPQKQAEALELARAFQSDYIKALAFQVLAFQVLAFQVPEILPEALEVARAIEDKYLRTKVLTELAPYFPEILPEALKVARAIGDKYNRSEALIPHSAG